ncbi:MAG: iron chaperone [Chthoniobacterales bacterium]
MKAERRRALQILRRQIKAAAPTAQECLSYGIPGFRLNGKLLVSYGAATKHCAFYPGSVVQEFTEELKGYDTSGRGTIRFSPEKPLGAALVRKIVKARIAQQTKAKPD